MGQQLGKRYCFSAGVYGDPAQKAGAAKGLSAIHSDAYRRRLPYVAGRLRKVRKQGFETICYPHFRRKGYLLPFYMIGYGTIRFFVEGLRSDSLYLLSGIRVSQVLSGCLIILGIVILFIISKRQVVRQ